MAQVSLPYTLQAGQPENVNQLVANLNALVAGVNTIDTAQIAANAVTFAKIANAGFLNSWSDTAQTGTVSTDLVYDHASITLTAGNWVVIGGAAVYTTTNADGVSLGLWEGTAVVANSQGATASTPAVDARVSILTAPVRIATSGLTLKVRVRRNGASTPNFGAQAGGAAGWIVALQIP